MTVIAFYVPGVPAPQGSKTPWGSEANPRTKPWRAAVTDKAHEAMNGRAPLFGPVKVEVVFSFTRPKAHFSADGKLKLSAPDYHIAPPDLDKLQRAIGDALEGVVVYRDKQIAVWRAVKRYDQTAGVMVTVTSLG